MNEASTWRIVSVYKTIPAEHIEVARAKHVFRVNLACVGIEEIVVDETFDSMM